MQKLTLKIVMLTFVFFAVSCSKPGKSSYISFSERFVKNVSKKQDTYTDEDWKKADLKFGQFSDYQKYVRKLIKDEKQKIGKLKGEYLVIRIKNTLDGFIDIFAIPLSDLAAWQKILPENLRMYCDD
jgi:hypothetical protein